MKCVYPSAIHLLSKKLYNEELEVCLYSKDITEQNVHKEKSMNMFFQLGVIGCVVSQHGDEIWNLCLNHQVGAGPRTFPSFMLN